MQTTALFKQEVPKATTAGKTTNNPLQRKAVGEEDDALQMKQDPLKLQTGLEEDEPLQMKKAPIQLMEGLDDEEEPLQMKQNPLQLKKSNQNPLQPKQAINNPLQLQSGETAAPEPKKNNTGLPDNLKTGVEALSGYSMDDVKVHYNSDKPAQLQALAYAQGTDIHVGPGQEKHLPHEAWHVVQQKQGKVQPTMQMKEGVAVNDDQGLESEADVMGTNASTRSKEKISQLFQFNYNASIKNKTIQRVVSAQLIPGQEQENNLIKGISSNGRPPNPFSGTMGAHSVAWIVHLDVIRTRLYNKTIDQAADEMSLIVLESQSMPGLKFTDSMEHYLYEELLSARQSMMQLDDEVHKADIAFKAMKIQQLISAYLTFINYIPFATIEASDTSGNTEGHWRGILYNYEMEGELPHYYTSLEELKQPLWSLFDFNAVDERTSLSDSQKVEMELVNYAGLTMEQFDEGADLSIFYGKDEEDSSVNIWAATLTTFFHSIEQAYPASVKASDILFVDSVIDCLVNGITINTTKEDKLVGQVLDEETAYEVIKVMESSFGLLLK